MNAHLPSTALNSSSGERHAPDVTELTARLAPYLRQEPGDRCQVAWLRRTWGRLLIEYCATSSAAPGAERRYIAKTYANGQGRAAFHTMRMLWDAGFRPPAAYAVPQPIIYLADRQVLLQAKAPGRRLADALAGAPGDALPDVERSAAWLGALHQARLAAPMQLLHAQAELDRCLAELVRALPHEVDRVHRLVRRAQAGLRECAQSELVVSHGGYQPEHIFVAADGRVTVVDFTGFSLHERAADVGHFLAHTAIQGYRQHHSFAATAAARQAFLQAYERQSALPRRRLGLHIGLVFLWDLHRQRVVLRADDAARAERWLRVAERCLLAHDLTLADELERTV